MNVFFYNFEFNTENDNTLLQIPFSTSNFVRDRDLVSFSQSASSYKMDRRVPNFTQSMPYLIFVFLPVNTSFLCLANLMEKMEDQEINI